MANKQNKNNKIVAIFMVLIIFVLHLSYNYLRDDIKDKTNLIIDNSNMTQELKRNIYIENSVIYISMEDISALFDNSIYYDETYNQIITTSYDKIASLTIDKADIQINSSNTNIKAGVIKKDNTYYIPFSELENVYNIKLKYNEDTNILIVDSLDKDYKIATATKNANVKYKPSGFSRTVAKVKKGQSYVIAENTSYTTKNGWTRVRTEDGILGYVKDSKIGKINTIREEIQRNINENKKDEKAYEYVLKYDVVKDYKLREKAINEITDYATQNEVKIVNIKIENIEENLVSRFLIELKPRLNEIGVGIYKS